LNDPRNAEPEFLCLDASLHTGVLYQVNTALINFMENERINPAATEEEESDE
jgi:hypothetical protein